MKKIISSLILSSSLLFANTSFDDKEDKFDIFNVLNATSKKCDSEMKKCILKDVSVKIDKEEIYLEEVSITNVNQLNENIEKIKRIMETGGTEGQKLINGLEIDFDNEILFKSSSENPKSKQAIEGILNQAKKELPPQISKLASEFINKFIEGEKGKGELTLKGHLKMSKEQEPTPDINLSLFKLISKSNKIGAFEIKVEDFKIKKEQENTDFTLEEISVKLPLGSLLETLIDTALTVKRDNPQEAMLATLPFRSLKQYTNWVEDMLKTKLVLDMKADIKNNILSSINKFGIELKNKELIIDKGIESIEHNIKLLEDNLIFKIKNIELREVGSAEDEVLQKMKENMEKIEISITN